MQFSHQSSNILDFKALWIFAQNCHFWQLLPGY